MIVPPERVCTGCTKSLALSAFRMKGSAPHYLCRPCERAAARHRHNRGRNGPSGIVARKALNLRCPQCGRDVPAGRLARGLRTCTRNCLLQSVGLPNDFDPALFNYQAGVHLSARAEHEIRVTLDSVILAAVAAVRS